MSWKTEEKDAYLFLKSFQLSKVDFEDFGKHNSSVPDIKVYKSNAFTFFIEVKMEEAQTSQFVVKKIDNRFEFSKLNKKGINKHKTQIIEYLNKNYSNFKNVNTKGIPINCEKNISFNHVISDLQSKNIKYIVVRKKNGPFKIIDINRLKIFFEIQGFLRRKKSGSSPVSKKDFYEIQKYLINKYNATDIKYTDSKKLLFKSKVSNLFGQYFNIKEHKYFIAKNKYNDFYRVNKTSKTNNPNVIFDLKLLDIKINDDKNKFLLELKT